MDALVYEDTPFASYIEGEALPFELPQEITPPHTPFAPKGLPQFQKRLNAIRKRRLSITPTSTGQLLERFRYVIVASQLLSEEAEPRPAASEHDLIQPEPTSVKGAAITAVLAFVAAWTLHWLRTRKRTLKIISWWDVILYSAGVTLLGTGAAYILQRLYIKQVQRSAISALSKFVEESHSFDTTANHTVRFIQEVEIVARGYSLTTPLPPISRLEDRHIIRRCQTLRKELATTLKSLTVLLVESHDFLQPFISKIDLQRYHDIYEVSLVEYSQAVELTNEASEEAEDSLKDLRFASRLHALTRKVFLCDLLALRQTRNIERLQQWSKVLAIIRDAQAETVSRQQSLAQALSAEEWGTGQTQSRPSSASELSKPASDASTPANQMLKSQNRRFDDVANAVRALNAKVHLLREEMNGLTAAKAEDCVLSSSIQKYYESLGVDIRNLLMEWERGRNIMLLNIDTERATATHYSRSSSSIRSPISPSPSLGNGLTIIDGGPAEALRLLNGDLDPHAAATPTRKSLGVDFNDEEVFEAVSKPRAKGNKRMSLGGMSREEKMAKLQEDRRKRATLQEQAENTTNMLRELRMVMKHRPMASMGGPSPGSGMTPSSGSSDDGERRQRITSI